MKENTQKKREKKDKGQSEQASTINAEEEKIQNNKVGGHNCNKSVIKQWGERLWSLGVMHYLDIRWRESTAAAEFYRKLLSLHINEVVTETVHFRSRRCLLILHKLFIMGPLK